MPYAQQRLGNVEAHLPAFLAAALTHKSPLAQAFEQHGRGVCAAAPLCIGQLSRGERPRCAGQGEKHFQLGARHHAWIQARLEIRRLFVEEARHQGRHIAVVALGRQVEEKVPESGQATGVGNQSAQLGRLLVKIRLQGQQALAAAIVLAGLGQLEVEPLGHERDHLVGR